MTTATKRRSLRWSLRSLLAATVVPGALIAYHFNWIRQRHAVLESGQIGFPIDGINVDRRAPLRLRILGENELLPDLMIVNSEISGGELARIRSLFPETTIWQPLKISPMNPDDNRSWFRWSLRSVMLEVAWISLALGIWMSCDYFDRWIPLELWLITFYSACGAAIGGLIGRARWGAVAGAIVSSILAAALHIWPPTDL